MSQSGIHPKYDTTTFTCGCGAVHTIASTIASGAMHVDLCCECHPFYTGKVRTVDTAGRIDRFKAKEAAAQSKKK